MFVSFSQSPDSSVERHLGNSPTPRGVTIGSVGSSAWLRVPAGMVLLKNVSFGAAGNYHARGGLPVMDDVSAQGVDIAKSGLDVWASAAGNVRAVGAFVIGRKESIQVRVVLQRTAGETREIFVRAQSQGMERVASAAIIFGAANVAEIDLETQNLAAERVGTIAEEWVWEYGVADGGGMVWEKLGVSPVRLYTTASVPINAIPRESFYHVACAIGGAADRAQAKRDVWNYFCNLDGKGMTTAQDKSLTMWKTAKPSNDHNEYVCRKAQGLVVNGDSSCLGWADLLREAFAIHGVESKVKYIWVDEKLLDLEVPTFKVHKFDGNVQTVREVGLIVKSYRWSEQGSITEEVFAGPNDVLHAGDFRWRVNLANNPVCLSWVNPDVTLVAQPGWLGWGANAYGIYCNHAVVLVDGIGDEKPQWYDPCHAIGPHEELLGYQKELLGEGELDGGGLFAVIGCRLRKQKNTTTGEDEVLCVGEIFCGAHPAPKTLCIKALDPN